MGNCDSTVTVPSNVPCNIAAFPYRFTCSQYGYAIEFCAKEDTLDNNDANTVYRGNSCDVAASTAQCCILDPPAACMNFDQATCDSPQLAQSYQWCELAAEPADTTNTALIAAAAATPIVIVAAAVAVT